MRLALLFLRIGVMNELHYRANFVIQLLQSLVAIATGLVVLTLIFDRTDDLAGWTRPQLLVVMGVFTIVGGVIGFAIEPNMGQLMSDVRLGTFDYALTKPVDAQLLASVREFRIWKLTDVLVGGCVLVWGILQLDDRRRVVRCGRLRPDDRARRRDGLLLLVDPHHGCVLVRPDGAVAGAVHGSVPGRPVPGHDLSRVAALRR